MSTLPSQMEQIDQEWLKERVRDIYNNHWGTGELKRFSRSTGINYNTLRSIAQSIGLVRPIKPITEPERDLLEKHAHKPIRSIIRIFRSHGYTRNLYWIRKQLRINNLKSNEGANNGYYTAASLAEGLGVTSDTVVIWLKQGLLKAERGFGRTWAISPRRFREFVRQYPQKIDLRKVTDQAWFFDLLLGV